jgi:hypothetical protein
VVIFQDARLEPGFQLAADQGRGLHFGQEGLMINPIEACGDIEFSRILRPIPNRREDRSNGIMAGPSWAKALGLR